METEVSTEYVPACFSRFSVYTPLCTGVSLLVSALVSRGNLKLANRFSAVLVEVLLGTEALGAVS